MPLLLLEALHLGSWDLAPLCLRILSFIVVLLSFSFFLFLFFFLEPQGENPEIRIGNPILMISITTNPTC